MLHAVPPARAAHRDCASLRDSATLRVTQPCAPRCAPLGTIHSAVRDRSDPHAQGTAGLDSKGRREGPGGLQGVLSLAERGGTLQVGNGTHR